MKRLRLWLTAIGILVLSAATLTGCGQITDAINAVTSTPSTPKGVAAVAGNGTVTISWQPVSGLVRYNIYVSTTPEVTPSTGTKIEDVTSPYSFTGENGKTYYFVVTAQNLKGESNPSIAVNATPSESAPPFIRATVLSSAAGGTPPWGYLTMIQVSSTSSDNTAIANANVSVNGTNIPWNAAQNEYSGNVVVAPGAPVTVEVTLGGVTYTASGTQFNAFPSTITPEINAVWQHTSPNTVTWTGGAPTDSSVYLVGILDNAGNTIYPAGNNGPHEILTTTTSQVIPANSLVSGSYYVLTGIGTPGIADGTGNGIPIPGAVSGSKLLLGGMATLVPITVQ